MDAERSVAYRFNPPGIDAGGEARVPDQVVIQRPFLHDLPTGHVDENGIVLHAAKLGGADQAVSGTGERRTDQQNVGRLQELIQPLRGSDPVRPLICPAMPVDGVHRHGDAVHQLGGCSFGINGANRTVAAISEIDLPTPTASSSPPVA
jgi:hypothetical protein